MPDHIEELNGPEGGKGSLLQIMFSFGHSTGRDLFYLCSLNVVTSASLLYPGEKPGSLGMTPYFSHPFGGNHKFLLWMMLHSNFFKNLFIFGCAGSSLLHTGFSLWWAGATVQSQRMGFSFLSLVLLQSMGYCPVAAHGLLIFVACLVAERGL